MVFKKEIRKKSYSRHCPSVYVIAAAPVVFLSKNIIPEIDFLFRCCSRNVVVTEGEDGGVSCGLSEIDQVKI